MRPNSNLYSSYLVSNIYHYFFSLIDNFIVFIKILEKVFPLNLAIFIMISISLEI